MLLETFWGHEEAFMYIFVWLCPLELKLQTCDQGKKTNSWSGDWKHSSYCCQGHYWIKKSPFWRLKLLRGYNRTPVAMQRRRPGKWMLSMWRLKALRLPVSRVFSLNGMSHLFSSFLFFFLKTCLQAVEVPWQQDPVSCDHTVVFDNLARPSLWIRLVLLHGILHHHCRETGTEMSV